jgi:hypothetical protein
MSGLRGEIQVSQRRLLLDDSDDEVRPRRRELTTLGVLEMLEQMATIMHYRTDNGLKWYARAVGSKGGFSEADTAVEAMQLAIKEKRT